MTDTPGQTRFARDLHDLLGGGLCAIIECVERSQRGGPAGERDSLRRILDLSRRTLADVRALTHVRGGYGADTRFARDVHDLLGLSLSAVTLKAELAARLLAVHPERARIHLAEIAELSRRAVGDVRSMVSGSPGLRVSEELDSARSVLVSAGIEARICAVDFEIPEPQSSVLATVMREGVTNVLRHSDARRCKITLRRLGNGLRLDIVNDGLSVDAGLDGDDGHGLRNLAQRVGELGGELSAGNVAGDTFRLRADLPMSAICRM